MTDTTKVEHGLAPNDNPQFGGEYCVCGSPMSWEDCWDCGGEGYHEMYESDPLWYDVDDCETCETCHGKGGYYICWKASKDG